MKIKTMFKQIRSNYVIEQVRRIHIPGFKPDKIMRYHIIFSGRVQRVGFRLEIEQLALRLKLTGWIKNLEDGNVEMEIQGMKNKIDFLLEFMNSLRRIKINQMQKDIRSVLNQEQEFKII